MEFSRQKIAQALKFDGLLDRADQESVATLAAAMQDTTPQTVPYLARTGTPRPPEKAVGWGSSPR